MFSKTIRDVIHPATFALYCGRQDIFGTTPRHIGTAFAVDERGHLLTCWHCTYADVACAEECDVLWVTQPEFGVGPYQTSVLEKSQDNDLAVLQIDDRAIRTRSATLLVEQRVPFGTSCAAFGHPMSITTGSGHRIFTRCAAGTVSMPFNVALHSSGPLTDLYELDLFAHGGLSGGPAFLRSGIVFGVIRASMGAGVDASGKKIRGNLSYAVDTREAIKLLEVVGVEPQVKRRIRTNPIAERLRHLFNPGG